MSQPGAQPKSKYIANLIETPADNRSWVEKLCAKIAASNANLTKDEIRAKLLEFITDNFTTQQALNFPYQWELWARQNQFPPPIELGWRVWMILAGRGFGKTRVGAETVRDWASSGKKKRIALVGPTTGDVNGVMLGGESGILSICPPWDMPVYNQAHRRLTWANGSIAEFFTAEEPKRLRGPQFDAAWCDEICSWRYPETWDMLQFGLRLGTLPQVIVTTTPKPQTLLKTILQSPTTFTTTGTTFENRTNMAESFFEEVKNKYGNSRLGQQELEAKIIEDVPGALWTRTNLDNNRVNLNDIDKLPDFLIIAVAVDPATTITAHSAETGICVAAYGADDNYYVLHLDGVKESPNEWGKRVLALYDQFQADRIVVEVNQGGKMVEDVFLNIRPTANVVPVHASRGKATRAEPVATLYERNRVKHVGFFPVAEDQMCFTENTKVSANEIYKVSKRLYSGSLVTIKTKYGEVESTANHPYLTDRGWIRADCINEDDILYYAKNKSQFHGKRIGELYDTLSKQSVERSFEIDGERFQLFEGFKQKSSVSVSENLCTADDFETLFVDKNRVGLSGRVDRWRGNNKIYSGLQWQDDKTSSNNFKYFLGSYGVDAIKNYLSRFFHFKKKNSERGKDVSIRLSRFGISTFLSKVNFFFSNKEASYQNTYRVGRNSYDSTGQQKEYVASAERASKVINEFEPTSITAIRRRQVENVPVYNLTTNTNWYLAENIVVHNCEFNPVENPHGLKDRVDALVWAITSLMEQTAVSTSGVPMVGGLRSKLVNYRLR